MLKQIASATRHDLKDTLSNAPTVQGSSFESLLAYYGSRLLPMRIIPPTSCAGFQWRSDFAAGPGVSIVRAQYWSDWSYCSDNDTENLNLGFLNAGASELRICSKTIEQTSSRLVVYPQPSLRRQAIRTRDGILAGGTLRFEASTVARILRDMFGGALLTSLDLALTFDLETNLGQALWSITSALVSGMRDEQLPLRSPKAMALLTESALRLIFAEAPHRLAGKLSAREGIPASPQISHAIDYMRANLHLPITMSDVAGAVGISSRALQTGFRRSHQTSPVHYLRRVRLDAVHTELSSPENKLPVSEVALKWGFAHMGRFAAQYRRTFGVFPSETARRAGGAHRLVRPEQH
ncbi:helix-turn-helix transcriptional regulator [Bradyrhizobium sp. UFLA05-112]